MGNELDQPRDPESSGAVDQPVQCIDCDTHYLIPSDLDPEKDPDVIRILAISDTHSSHHLIESTFKSLPKADILVHGGDFTNLGTLRDIQSYDQWIGNLVKKQQIFEYAVLIAGNHDITLEEDFYNTVGFKRFHHGTKQDYKQCIDIVRNGNNVYLEDEAVELLGVSFYGSPYQPEFCQWAFNLPRGEATKKEWAKIPDKGIDVLITHGPPKYHGDRVEAVTNVSDEVGCDDLRDRLKEIKDRPQFHVFGHIHEGYGVTRDKEIEGVTFINASTVNMQYKVTNKPIMFYVKGRGRQYSDRQSLWEKNDSDHQDAQEKEEEQKENLDNTQNPENSSQIMEVDDEKDVEYDADSNRKMEKEQNQETGQ